MSRKKVLSGLLALVLIFALTGCINNKTDKLTILPSKIARNKTFIKPVKASGYISEALEEKTQVVYNPIINPTYNSVATPALPSKNQSPEPKLDSQPVQNPAPNFDSKPVQNPPDEVSVLSNLNIDIKQKYVSVGEKVDVQVIGLDQKGSTMALDYSKLKITVDKGEIEPKVNYIVYNATTTGWVNLDVSYQNKTASTTLGVNNGTPSKIMFAIDDAVSPSASPTNAKGDNGWTIAYEKDYNYNIRVVDSNGIDFQTDSSKLTITNDAALEIDSKTKTLKASRPVYGVFADFSGYSPTYYNKSREFTIYYGALTLPVKVFTVPQIYDKGVIDIGGRVLTPNRSYEISGNYKNLDSFNKALYLPGATIHLETNIGTLTVTDASGLLNSGQAIDLSVNDYNGYNNDYLKAKADINFDLHISNIDAIQGRNVQLVAETKDAKNNLIDRTVYNTRFVSDATIASINTTSGRTSVSAPAGTVEKIVAQVIGDDGLPLPGINLESTTTYLLKGSASYIDPDSGEAVNLSPLHYVGGSTTDKSGKVIFDIGYSRIAGNTGKVFFKGYFTDGSLIRGSADTNNSVLPYVEMNPIISSDPKTVESLNIIPAADVRIPGYLCADYSTDLDKLKATPDKDTKAFIWRVKDNRNREIVELDLKATVVKPDNSTLDFTKYIVFGQLTDGPSNIYSVPIDRSIIDQTGNFIYKLSLPEEYLNSASEHNHNQTPGTISTSSYNGIKSSLSFYVQSTKVPAKFAMSITGATYWDNNNKVGDGWSKPGWELEYNKTYNYTITALDQTNAAIAYTPALLTINSARSTEGNGVIITDGLIIDTVANTIKTNSTRSPTYMDVAEAYTIWFKYNGIDTLSANDTIYTVPKIFATGALAPLDSSNIDSRNNRYYFSTMDLRYTAKDSFGNDIQLPGGSLTFSVNEGELRLNGANKYVASGQSITVPINNLYGYGTSTGTNAFNRHAEVDAIVTWSHPGNTPSQFPVTITVTLKDAGNAVVDTKTYNTNIVLQPWISATIDTSPVPAGTARTFNIVAKDALGNPIPDATINLSSSSFDTILNPLNVSLEDGTILNTGTAQAITDAQGKATFNINTHKFVGDQFFNITVHKGVPFTFKINTTYIAGAVQSNTLVAATDVVKAGYTTANLTLTTAQLATESIKPIGSRTNAYFAWKAKNEGNKAIRNLPNLRVKITLAGGQVMDNQPLTFDASTNTYIIPLDYVRMAKGTNTYKIFAIGDAYYNPTNTLTVTVN